VGGSGTNVCLGLRKANEILFGAGSHTQSGTRRYIVILTDGDNTMPTDGNSNANDLNHSEYTAYGFAAQARMGAGIDTEAEMVVEQNASLSRVCDNIKAVKLSNGNDAIHVYTIALGKDVDANKPLLESCASDPSKDYFDAPSKDTLSAAFKAIGTSLSKIRLTR